MQGWQETTIGPTFIIGIKGISCTVLKASLWRVLLAERGCGERGKGPGDKKKKGRKDWIKRTGRQGSICVGCVQRVTYILCWMTAEVHWSVDGKEVLRRTDRWTADPQTPGVDYKLIRRRISGRASSTGLRTHGSRWWVSAGMWGSHPQRCEGDKIIPL